MSDREGDRRHNRRFAAGGNGYEPRDPRDIAEIERLQQRIRELELHQDQQEHSTTESDVWDDGDDQYNVFGRNQGRRTPPRQPQTDPLRTLGIRTEIPEFEGRMQADDFIDWLQTVERIFDLRQIPENYKVKLVAIRLRKYASLWWEHVQKQRQREGKHRVETWDKMKRLLRSKFLPVNHKQDSFLDYHNLKQNSLSVEEFIMEFEKLRMRCGIEEDEEQVIARFLGALRSEISDIVYLQQFWSFNDVCRLSQRVEKQLLQRQKQPPSRYPTRSPTVTTNPTRAGSSKTESSFPPPAVTSTGTPPHAIKCFKCGGFGHLKRDCPTKQIIALVDDPLATYDTETEQEPDNTEVIFPDRGEALVIQRILSTSVNDTSDDTQWLRNNIFRTKCTSKGKVCTVIVDGGSCENIVATSMVEKLNLPLQPHPEPYQLTWLKKGNLIKVTHRCLVQFSIGNKYTDELWCEVLPMDACHILLGRPWQYDRRVKHDGFRNTYSLLEKQQ